MEQFILEWNASFPLDKWWRQKYNIPLFSSQHLEISQIDILLEYTEHILTERYKSRIEEQQRAKEQLEKGRTFIDEEDLNETEEELFDKLDLSTFNKQKE